MGSQTHETLTHFIRCSEGNPRGSFCFPRTVPRYRSDLDIGQGNITMDFQHVHTLEGWETMGIVKELLAIGVNFEAVVATANGELWEKGGTGVRPRSGDKQGAREGDPGLTSKYCPGPNGLKGSLLSSGPHDPFRWLFRTTTPSCRRGLMCSASSPVEPTLKLMAKLGAKRGSQVRVQCLGLQRRKDWGLDPGSERKLGLGPECEGGGWA